MAFILFWNNEIFLGPKRPRGRPKKREVYDDLNAIRDGNDMGRIPSDQTFGEN